MEAAIRTHKPGRGGKILFFLLLFISIGFFIFYLISGITYSEGTRSGILTKVSKKGFVFKTYEGELNIGGFSQGDGTIMPSTIFYFSVNSEEVYKKLEALQGTKVVVRYKEVVKNLFWQGDTNYFETDVKSTTR